MNDGAYNTFTSREALDEKLAKDVANKLLAAIEARGKASLVVSGGSTPLNFFKVLSVMELPWEHVTVTLADERWVEPTHADSNEKLVRTHLLVNHAAAATFLPMKNAELNAEQGTATLAAALNKLGRFDVVILGMGGDGHTASLFPKASVLRQAIDMNSGLDCMAVDPVTAPHQRMTMTLPRLLNAEQIIIHITGDEKKTVLENANRCNDIDQQCQLPVSLVLQQQQTPVSIYWAE